MSFLFHRKTKKVLNYLWGAIALIVMVSMILFFAPGLVNYILS